MFWTLIITPRYLKLTAMPEGPSIAILREEMQKLHLEGKKVLSVSGNTSIDLERFPGETLKEFKSWGKHFLICFEDFTLRIHLMMFGTYRINERKETTPRISLVFEGAELNFYTCSLKIIEGSLDAAYEWSADVLSPHWDPKKAIKKLNLKPELLVCDALLNQEIFAGVGNIIKNEVLYRIRVHPLSTIGALPPPQLKELVAEARIYSFEFLEWKKEFTLKKHWLVYNKRTCIRCKLPFHKDHLGKTKRRTFYCNNCQKEYLLEK